MLKQTIESIRGNYAPSTSVVLFCDGFHNGCRVLSVDVLLKVNYCLKITFKAHCNNAGYCELWVYVTSDEIVV